MKYVLITVYSMSSFNALYSTVEGGMSVIVGLQVSLVCAAAADSERFWM